MVTCTPHHKTYSSLPPYNSRSLKSCLAENFFDCNCFLLVNILYSTNELISTLRTAWSLTNLRIILRKTGLKWFLSFHAVHCSSDYVSVCTPHWMFSTICLNYIRHPVVSWRIGWMSLQPNKSPHICNTEWLKLIWRKAGPVMCTASCYSNNDFCLNAIMTNKCYIYIFNPQKYSNQCNSAQCFPTGAFGMFGEIKKGKERTKATWKPLNAHKSELSSNLISSLLLCSGAKWNDWVTVMICSHSTVRNENVQRPVK